MQILDHRTPIRFHDQTSWSEWALEKIERYFEPIFPHSYDSNGRTITIAHVISRTPSSYHVLLESHPAHLDCHYTALKVASYFTVVLPLILLVVRCALHLLMNEFVHNPSPDQAHASFYAQFAATLQQQGFHSEHTPRDLSSLMPSILAHEDTPKEIRWISKEPYNLIFQLHTYPNLIFKINDRIQDQCTRMVHLKRFCFIHDFHHVDPPATQIVQVASDNLEGQTTNPGASTQVLVQEYIDTKQLLSTYSGHGYSHTCPAVQQMTRFIAETRLGCAHQRNVRIVNTTSQHHWIVPLHLYSYETSQKAMQQWVTLFGHDQDVNMAAVEALRCAVATPNRTQPHSRHEPHITVSDLKEAGYKACNAQSSLSFHVRTHSSQIPLDKLSRYFTNETEKKGSEEGAATTTLQQAARDVVEAIHAELRNKPQYGTKADQRLIILTLQPNTPLWAYRFHNSYIGSTVSWLENILNTLKKCEWIFQWSELPGNRYEIQV